MKQAIVPLVLGAGFGAVIAASWLGSADDSGSVAGSESSVLTAIAERAFGRNRSADNEVTTADRLRVYRTVQNESDSADLERDIRQAAAREASIERDLEIDAALMRLMEIAPAQGVELAIRIPLDTHLIAAALVTLAEADAEAALALLPEIPDRRTRIQSAIALLDVTGENARGLDRIARALEPRDQDALTLGWLARRAETDAPGAFRDALQSTSGPLQEDALSAIAVSWAAQDPAGALIQSSSLPENLASGFRQTVYTEWARIDLAGFVAHVESVGAEVIEVQTAFQYVLYSDPALAIRITDGLSGDDMVSRSMASALRQSAQGQLAVRDLDAATAQLAAMSPGTDRDRLAQAIASALAQRDPFEAVAWVRTLDPPSPNAYTSIMSMVALTDIDAAFELLGETDIPGPSGVMITMIASRVMGDPRRAREFVNRLSARDDAESRQALSTLVASWMQRDPGSALDWIVASGTDVDSNLMRTAAMDMARRDIVGAAEYTDRLPERYRGAWVIELARHYAANDSAAALDWLNQYQGRDYYDIALRETVNQLARTNPRAAAQALSRASPDAQLASAPAVARSYSQQDPRAAANWALGLTDDRVRPQAVMMAVNVWLQSDPAAARRFTLDMAAGEVRDNALTALLGRSMSTGTVDASLLDAYSSQRSREEGLASALPTLYRNDPDEALAVLEREIRDPRIRREVEDRFQGGSPAPSFSIPVLLP